MVVLVEVFGVVGGTVGLLGVVGVGFGEVIVTGVENEEFTAAAEMSFPIGAKGFGRPSVPSGTKRIVES